MPYIFAYLKTAIVLLPEVYCTDSQLAQEILHLVGHSREMA